MSPTAAGVLYVVATPIGNLEDITFRAVRILKASALIAAEDTRVTAKLTQKFEIGTRLVTILGKNAKKNISMLIDRLRAGEDVALVTDAGTPSVSDPGFELVTAANQAGIRVSPIPGPSALAAAVSVSGLKGEGVRFFGFLPRGGRRRKELVAAVACETALSVIYESPRRLAQTLAELSEACETRSATVLRELTKINEEVVTGFLDGLAARFSEAAPKGEITLLVEGLQTGGDEMSDADLMRLIERDLDAGKSTKDIANRLSKGLGVPKKHVYQLALSALSERA